MPELAWVSIGLSLIALGCSLLALRRPRLLRSASSIAASPAVAPVGNVQDPAIIAVLTAAVAMMMSESSPAPRQTAAANSSVAGFTIRAIRRV